MKKISLTSILVLVMCLLGAQQLYARFDPFLERELKQHNELTVIELYTSQSCSSCPEADAILERAGENKDIITLGFHVDYWDHLKWKDTVSRGFASKRQRNIASHRNSSRVYTPQMIVNGDAEFTGTNANKLKLALSKTDELARIDLWIDDGQLHISPKGMDTRVNNIQFWVFGTKDRLVQKMSAGENSGKQVTYVDAVLYQGNLGRVSGELKDFNVPAPTHWVDADRLVVIAQEKGFGPIVAAGKMKF